MGEIRPLYEALNAGDCYAGVSGNGTERRYKLQDILEAISSLRSKWQELEKLDVDEPEESQRANITWSISEKIQQEDKANEKVKSGEEDSECDFIVYGYANQADFLARCLKLLIEYPDDEIEIGFY